MEGGGETHKHKQQQTKNEGPSMTKQTIIITVLSPQEVCMAMLLIITS